MGVWTYDSHQRRIISTCTQEELCSTTIFQILFGIFFLFFFVQDIPAINMWTLSGWLHRIQVVFLETVMCAVVAFFVADLGLDVFRVQYRDGSSEVAYNNVLFYVAVIVPLFLSLCARAGPCLVYCLPEWARSQSHQVRISKSSKKMDPAPRPLRSSRGADRTTTTPPPPPTTTTTTTRKNSKSAKQKFKDNRAFSTSKKRKKFSLKYGDVASSIHADALQAAHSEQMLKSIKSIGSIHRVASIDDSRWGHNENAEHRAMEKTTRCRLCSCKYCWCLPHPWLCLQRVSYRLRHLIHFLFSGVTWDLYESYSAFLSIASVYIYLHGTYETSAYRMRVDDATSMPLPHAFGHRPVWKQDCPASTTPWTHWPQQYLESALAIDFVLRLVASSRSKFQKFFSLYMLSDLLSISMLPVWILGFPPELLRSFGCLRFLRLLRLTNHYALVHRLSKIQLKKWRVYMIVTSLFMVTAGLILTVEYGDESGFICFHDALYFSVVSLLTVGLGDLAPISFAGRVLATMMLVVGVALVSYQLNELEAANKKQAKFKYTRSLAASIEGHIILCGDVLRLGSVKVFLEEFCHPNHRGVDDLRLPAIVLMCPHPPSTELEHFLEVMMGRDRKDGSRITLTALQGLPSSVRDLHRVGGEY